MSCKTKTTTQNALKAIIKIMIYIYFMAQPCELELNSFILLIFNRFVNRVSPR